MKEGPRRWRDRHSLCDCPRSEVFPWQIRVNREACRGGTIAHPPPLGAAEIAAIIEQLRKESNGQT